MKCSADGITHSTCGCCGPALPSVLPVRWALPRYVVQAGAADVTTKYTKHTKKKTLHFIVALRIGCSFGSLFVCFVDYFSSMAVCIGALATVISSVCILPEL